MGSLDGLTVLVTGAARGQGRCHAVRCAEEGANVVALDLCADLSTIPYPLATEEDLAETASAVKEVGGRVHAEVADIRDLPGLTGAVERGVGVFGRLDCVIANAGVISSGRLDSMTAEQFEAMIDVNLVGAWKTARAAVPHLRAGGRGGSVIFINSLMGLKATQNIGHYAAAKHGMIGLMKALAKELAPEDIRVNAIAPTNVATPMIFNDWCYRTFRPDLSSPGKEDIAEALSPMQELDIPWIEPVDVANMAVFLASPQARYITGAALSVDGGALLA